MPYPKQKKPGFSGKPYGSSGFTGGEKRFHKATCAQCSAECTVPFKPNGRKPVLCSNCMQREKSSEKRSGYEPRQFGRPSYSGRPDAYQRPPGTDSTASLRKEIDALNAKLDRILAILEDGNSMP